MYLKTWNRAGTHRRSGNLFRGPSGSSGPFGAGAEWRQGPEPPGGGPEAAKSPLPAENPQAGGLLVGPTSSCPGSGGPVFRPWSEGCAPQLTCGRTVVVGRCWSSPVVLGGPRVGPAWTRRRRLRVIARRTGRTALRADACQAPERRRSTVGRRPRAFRFHGEVAGEAPGRQGVLPECLPGMPHRI